MKLHITRESVCAGDDVDAPHARQMKAPDGASVEELIKFVARSAELPRIAGGKATWCLSSLLPLAVLAEQWNEVRIIHDISPELNELEFDGGTLQLHITYLAQEDPEIVYRILRRLRLQAP